MIYGKPQGVMTDHKKIEFQTPKINPVFIVFPKCGVKSFKGILSLTNFQKPQNSALKKVWKKPFHLRIPEDIKLPISIDNMIDKQL